MAPLGTLVALFQVAKTAGLLLNARTFPVLRPGRAAWRQTSILVPARDEENNLGRTLLGLLKQPAAEILVLDDQSTDGTADAVRAMAKVDSRLRLIEGSPPPPGWIGKNWACHQLAQAAAGTLLVFCDADVTMRPGALTALWRQIDAQNADVFSVFPRQVTGSAGEAMLVPLIDETLLAFLPHGLLRLPIPAACAANGQVLAFTRPAYAAVGGHEAVAGEIVEDLALARLSRERGLRLGLALGGALIDARMYQGYSALIKGFGKSLRSAHGNRDALLVASALGHLIAYTLPWLRLGDGPAWRLAAGLGVAQRLLTNAKTGRSAYAEAALLPFIAPAALPLYREGLRRTATWKGREYP